MSPWSPVLEWAHINDALQMFYMARAACSVLQHNRAWETLSVPAMDCASLPRGGFWQELNALRMILQAQNPFISLSEELYIANKGA